MNAFSGQFAAKVTSTTTGLLQEWMQPQLTPWPSEQRTGQNVAGCCLKSSMIFNGCDIHVMPFGFHVHIVVLPFSSSRQQNVQTKTGCESRMMKFSP